MKTSTTLSLILVAGLSSTLLQACGAYNKSPADGLQDLKASAQKENDTRNLDQPQVINQPVEVKVPTPYKEIQVVYKNNPTETVIKTQATIDSNTIVISTDETLRFVEGQVLTVPIRTRVMIPDVKIALKSDNLPEGAKLEASTTEANLYNLTWTAPYNSVPANNVQRIQKVTFSVDIVSTPNDAVRNQLNAIKKSREVFLLILRDQTPPSDLKVDLKNELLEGSLTPFTVTVKVPGVDGSSGQKPMLQVAYDGYPQNNNFLEMDGSRYISHDSTQQEAKYIGDFKWQFSLVFDTKNTPVQPQVAKDGSLITNADGTRVRLSFKALSPFGAATAWQVSSTKIVYNYNLTAPRFDLSSLGGNSLEVAPGDNLRMVFIAEAGRAQGEVKVEVPNLTGISGNPKITCAASSVGNYRQICQINWSVPCNAKAADLNQKITLSAQTLIGDKKSDPVKQEIVLTPSKVSSNKCVAAVVGK